LQLGKQLIKLDQVDPIGTPLRNGKTRQKKIDQILFFFILLFLNYFILMFIDLMPKYMVLIFHGNFLKHVINSYL
jgi:hypothetical protein